MTVLHGDCITVMRGMAADSVDAIVTDPPYGLGFMGKAWDNLPPGEEWARECLRVLKPGGHLLAFGGTRTWHRLAVAVEDAGFEIRDSIAWLYGSGFPKNKHQVKPAFEPILFGRKPFKGTVAANIALHGTGSLNIDGCRIPMGDEYDPTKMQRQSAASAGMKGLGESGFKADHVQPTYNAAGRWPANVILDDDQAAALDAQSGVTKDGVAVQRNLPPEGSKQGAVKFKPSTKRAPDAGYGGQGGASRFFYCAKAPKNERPKVDGVSHPTVKPLSLMRWLVRLVTPPGGTVLDPFAGSGTTLEAATLEGFDVIGIEREAEYLPLINMRVARASAAEPTPDEPALFGDAS